jgi:hypothetical protein
MPYARSIPCVRVSLWKWIDSSEMVGQSSYRRVRERVATTSSDAIKIRIRFHTGAATVARLALALAFFVDHDAEGEREKKIA